MISVAIAAITLALACVAIHYETLRGISHVLPALRVSPRLKILVVIVSALAGHIFEIGLYAAGYYAGMVDTATQTGGGDAIAQAICLSLDSYSSLGTDTVIATAGPLHILAGTEALVGLILIGWTTSYTYLAMRELWNQQ